MFLVMDVGCLHCGLDVDVIGVYDTREKANVVVEHIKRHYIRPGEWKLEIFTLPAINAVSSAYKEYL